MGKTLKRNFLFTAATVALICGAVSSAYALDPTAKWCAGVKIAAFPGGPQGGVFANNVYNGYRQAELDLGPSVTYYFSNWDPNLMITQLQQAIATKVDGIAFMGHPGDAATDPQIDKAFAQGIVFTTAKPRCLTRRPSTGRRAWATSARPIISRASPWRRSGQARRPEGGRLRRSYGASRVKAGTVARARLA